ncbi:MAG: TIGR04211 family SH3 domain-containing protein [Shewanella sp.]
MLKFFALVGLLLLSPILLAANQTGYISDNIYLYLHGGPGTEFRILGSVEAGQTISIMGETQGNYTKIIDHKGREGWIEEKMVTRQKSFRKQLPEIQAQLNDTKSELEQALISSAHNDEQVSKLQSELSQAQQDLAKASSERDNATHKLASIENNKRFQMWQEGGIIAAIGLLIGVILVYLPRPRRKQKNRW